MNITIKDVARETGLAISTISKYINGGNVRKENKEQIDAAIKKLNYIPNQSARGLRTQKSYRIGVMTDAEIGPHFSSLIGEIERTVTAQDYSLIFLGHHNNQMHNKECVDYLISSGIDGLLTTVPFSLQGELSRIRDAGISVVTMEERCLSPVLDCVQVDCTRGAYEIVESMIRMGHQKIAIICGPEELKLTAKERLRGYLRAMEDYEIPVNKEFLISGDFSYKSGYNCLKRLWNLPQRPTSVFVANYDMCMGVMEAVRELGICIPDQLSLAVFDDFDLSIISRPKLTAVRQPIHELAAVSCSLLQKRMRGDSSDFPRIIRLKPECIYRESICPPKHVSENKP